MDMKDSNEISARLDKIEASITAKGHPMQDYSTLKMAMVDLIDIVRKVVKTEQSSGRKTCGKS